MRDLIEKEIYINIEDLNDSKTTEKYLEVSASIVNIINNDSSISKVKEFMKTFNQSISENPVFPDEKIMELRLNIMLEELIELSEAMGPTMYGYMQRLLFNHSQKVHYDMEKKRETMKPDMVKVLDSLCDQRYVNDGTILAFGLDKVFEEAFDDVHKSNMSKACDCQEDEEATIEKYKQEGIECISEHRNGLAIILRTSDRKVVKSINYNPVKLEKYIENV